MELDLSTSVAEKTAETSPSMQTTGFLGQTMNVFEKKPALGNPVQAQRDYFDIHAYERVDKPRGQVFHMNWPGTGGRVASSTYTV